MPYTNGTRVQHLAKDIKGEVVWDTYHSPDYPYSIEVLWDVDPVDPNKTAYSQYSSLNVDTHIKAL